MKFMRQIRNGDGTLKEGEEDDSSNSTADHWSLEYNGEQNVPKLDWSAQFLADNPLHGAAGMLNFE